MSEFVTLLSNTSSNDIFPFNKPYSFQTQFSETIRNNGVGKIALWEVSLSNALESDTDLSSVIEIYSWIQPRYVVTKQGTKTVRVLTGYGQKISITDSRKPLPKPVPNQINGNKWVRLSEADLSTPQSLVSAVNACVYNSYDPLKFTKRPLFSYCTEMRKIWFDWPMTDELFLTVVIKNRFLTHFGCIDKDLPSNISEIVLGKSLTGSSFVYNKQTLRFNDDFKTDDILSQCNFRNFFKFSPHLRKKYTNFLIYSNLCCESRIANTKATLLRWLEIDTVQPISRKCINFAQSLQYFDCTQEQISSCGIDILDENGHFIPLSEPVRIVLHILYP